MKHVTVFLLFPHNVKCNTQEPTVLLTSGCHRITYYLHGSSFTFTVFLAKEVTKILPLWGHIRQIVPKPHTRIRTECVWCYKIAGYGYSHTVACLLKRGVALRPPVLSYIVYLEYTTIRARAANGDSELLHTCDSYKIIRNYRFGSKWKGVPIGS